VNSTPPNHDKPVIGVTGGIGSGKSLAAGMLAELGCAVIDADSLGHDVLTEPEVRDALVAMWGPRVLKEDRQIDRGEVAKIVFSDQAELERLTDISYPRIALRIERQIAQLRQRPDVPAIVLDAAVLFEAGWDAFCTHILFIDAPAQLRADRSAQRGWTRSHWLKREKSQIPLDTKRDRCYRRVDNSSSVTHLREQIRRIYHQILHEAV
jgi:dephospho-CoA kinase